MNRKIIIGVVVIALVATAATVGQSFLFHRGAVAVPRQSVLTVNVITPDLREWPQSLQASGALAAWQEAVIGAEVGSLRITDILVDVGSTVTKGQELAHLATDSTLADLHKQDALVAQAKASLDQAKANAERARKVSGSGALSEQQVKEYLITEETAQANLASAEAARESTKITLDKTSIRAVDDGIVTSRSATLGTVVSAGTELFRLLRQGRVEWNAEVDAQQLAQVKVGQKAVLTLPGGARIEGQVRVAAPSLNANTSRAIVYVSLPSDSGAATGSFASGEIELPVKTALTVPQSAVVLRDGRSYIFTVKDDSSVTRKVVATGRRHEDRVEILGGLEAAERVVASGGAFLSEGSVVTVAKSEVQ